ncbi:adenylate cyclase [Rhizobium viscosum]|uniref:DNA-binding SARP family transcriptional activator/tetratricopeptide (TPR) repeat protein n=1 Tax=Rhizobium viscosum TaxID=1673 RepID=A0ABR9J0G9_RHIVS|nr:peptide antibiotic resistance protein [Rhizobium viscosum]MBE1508934.1 DNA-binding SARP family transcriptional activator/tetratricopeptide (TPR) repeat protein [Rhizobium viscosum]
MVHLQTFGELRLTDGLGAPIRYPVKALVMLAYLHCSPDQQRSRQELARFLWNETGDHLADLNLRKLISRIRDATTTSDEQILNFGPPFVTLNKNVLSVDLDILRREEQPVAQLAAVSDLVQRGFIPGLNASTRAIDGWIERERQLQLLTLRDIFVRAADHVRDDEERRLLRRSGLQLLEAFPGDEQIRSILRGTADDHSQRRPQVARAVAMASSRIAEQQDAGMPQIITATSAPRLVLLPPGAAALTREAAIADALIEDVTIELCALRNISVVAPHTAEQIRRDSDKATIVQRHSISYLLDTRLSGEGLYAQLIYFPTDEILWAARFDMAVETLPTQRRLIAQKLADAVSGQLKRNESIRLRNEGDPQAYHSYLVGAGLLTKLSLPDIRRARKSFKRALHFSPNYAPAFTGLARTFTSEWLLTAQGDPALLQFAEDQALRAIERDLESAAGHRELGVAKLYRGAVDDSVAALDLAESLSPHYADVIYSHADTLVHASRPEDALEKIKKAISLNPIAPDAYLWCAAGASYFLERYEEALGFVDRMKDKAPAYRIAAASCAMIGDRKRAQFYRQRAELLNPAFEVEKWLALVPFKEQWQKELYRDGLFKAGFSKT